jgi:hypothetical protein
MDSQHTDNTSDFRSIDDIINFYKDALQHSERQKELISDEETEQ